MVGGVQFVPTNSTNATSDATTTTAGPSVSSSSDSPLDQTEHVFTSIDTKNQIVDFTLAGLTIMDRDFAYDQIVEGTMYYST